MVITSMSNNHTSSPEIALSGAKRPQGALAYDHKMLWRANLYIDEEEDDDWNDTHPWIVKNEWNREVDSDSIAALLSSNDISTLPAGDGGQVVDFSPYPWTLYQDSNDPDFPMSNPDYINEYLPYTTGGSDSPFSMVKKILNQQPMIENAMINSLYGYSGGSEDSIWTSTTAPGSKQAPFSGNSDWINYLDDEAAPLILNEVIYYPYRPSFTSIMEYTEIGTGYDTADLPASIGVDCSGFLQRCASYLDSPYGNTGDVDRTDGSITSFTDDQVDYWDDSAASGVREGTVGIEPASIEFSDEWRNKIVPGDIFLMSPSHVVIIQSIDYGDTRYAEDDEITVIEATGTVSLWRLANHRTLENLLDQYSDITVRRLNYEN